ncbi:hypothetical protein Pse7367_0607 [Thalassoporum mexicanum PCC 7367]|nr:hypothetical protein Pse7367_0607 [Pseudanabaena sp. PCC 7367]
MGMNFIAMTPELSVADVVKTQQYFRNVIDIYFTAQIGD